MQGNRSWVRAVALLAVLVLVAGCGGESLTGKVVKDAGITCVQPKALPVAEGKPAPGTVPTRPPIADLEVTDIRPGTGAAAKVGDKLVVELYVVSCQSGQQLYSTWDATAPPTTAPADPTASSTTAAPGPTGPQPLVLRDPPLPEGLLKGLEGMAVGGQRRIVIPPNLGLGSKGGALPVGGQAGPNDTLVYVVQLDDVQPGPPPCADATVTPPTPGPAPTVNVAADAYGPDALVKKDLTVGTGPALKLGDAYTLNYAGFVCATGKEFDESFTTGKPLTGTASEGSLIPGFLNGLVGMQAGGRRELVIPADQAYGASGQGADIPPNAALIFVIDLTKIG